MAIINWDLPATSAAGHRWPLLTTGQLTPALRPPPPTTETTTAALPITVDQFRVDASVCANYNNNIEEMRVLEDAYQ